MEDYDYINILNRQPKEGLFESLSPLQLNELRTESHYAIMKIREELENAKRKSMQKL